MGRTLEAEIQPSPASRPLSPVLTEAERIERIDRAVSESWNGGFYVFLVPVVLLFDLFFYVLGSVLPAQPGEESV